MAASGKESRTKQQPATPVGEVKGNVKAGSLVMVNILAVVFGLVIVGLQFKFSPDNLLAVGMSLMGMVLGAVSVFMPPQKAMTAEELAQRQGRVSPKEILLMLAIAFFVLGAGLGPITGTEFIAAQGSASGWTTYFSMLSQILIYALAFLLFVEYSYASLRYAGIKQYAEVQGLELELNPVINTYLGVSIMLSLLATAVAFGVFLLSKAISMSIPSAALRASIEFNSLYGVAITAGAVFGLIALIYTMVFSWESFQKITRSFQVEEEEEVE